MGKGRVYTVGALDGELLLLLDEVGAADEAHGDFFAELVQELEHLGAHIL